MPILRYNIPMTSKNENAKRERRDRTKEILNAATRLFSEKGFRGTSLASIAEAVGLTEPGLLHYFPSKVRLLQGVLAFRDKQDVDKYSDLTDSDEKSLETILDSLNNLVIKNEDNPALTRLFTILVSESIRSDHPSHEYFVDRYQMIRRTFTDYITGLDDWEISVDIDALASILVAVMDGLQIQWLLDPDSVNMVEGFNLFTKIMIGYFDNKMLNK